MTDNKRDESGRVSQKDSSVENRTDKVGRGRSVGRGMDSPDSTEAVLDASTGEPDPRARGEGSLTSGSSRDASAKAPEQQSDQQSKQQPDQRK